MAHDGTKERKSLAPYECKCCGSTEPRVLKTYRRKDRIERRRECTCGWRWTTVERIIDAGSEVP